MNSSFLQKSVMNMSMSFNSSFMSTSSRRGKGGGDATMVMSNGLTQVVETYQTQLPAMIRVALTSASGDWKQFSCRLDPSGWAWLVTGRRLYVWRHTQDAGGKKTAVTCRELQLPASDVPHNAKNVVILPPASSSATSSSNAAPSCLAVSPEGHITYWPNISNESNTVTLNADLTGQECDSLTSIFPLGCIATTTSSTILLIKTVGGRGNKPGLSCAPLLQQSTWLGGWSKKMTSMLFSNTATTDLQKRVRVVIPLEKDDDPMFPGNNRAGVIYTVQGSTVQTWQFTQDSYLAKGQSNFEDILKSMFLENVWATEEGRGGSGDTRAIQTWVLDAVSLPSNRSQLAIFAAAKSTYENPSNLVYGIAVFDITRCRTKQLWSFIPMMSSVGPSAVEDEQVYNWKLLANQTHFFVICPDSVHTASIDKETPADVIESSSLGGSIIGAGNISSNSVVILVPKLGLLSVKPAQVQEGLGLLDDTFTDVRVPDHLAMSMTQANLAELQESDDIVNKYKSAFLLFLQKKVDDCNEILYALFPPDMMPLTPHDPLDISTVAFAEKLIDEAPVADPRWGASFRTADENDQLGLKSKILIKNFLVDKRESLELFITFLHGAGVVKRLTGVVLKEDTIATASILYNAYEKVYFAMSLQGMQNEPQYRKLLDTAIRSLVMMRRTQDPIVRSTHLSPNDIFYKDVSKVHQVIPALVSLEEEDLHSLTPLDIPNRLRLTNEIILRAVFEVNSVATVQGEKLAQVHELLVKPLMSTESRNPYQVLPWLAEKNVNKALAKQHELVVSHGIRSTDIDQEVKLELIRQLQQLTDVMLDALRNNLVSMKRSERYPSVLQHYETVRSRLLHTHLDFGDYDGATQLAEKYLDFEILTTVCYERRDLELLKEYFSKYEEMEFAEFTWEWYVRHGKAAELVETFSPSGNEFGSSYGPQLKRFLSQYPHISWHHSSVNDKFGEAAGILRGLAGKEEAYADDKKFLLCLGKLASLANEEETTDIDNNLHLLEFQARIPDEILNVFGMERETMRVLNPSEMIDMYTTPEVHFESENFANALGLADFMINDDLQTEKRLLIASRAIERDPWEQWTRTDHPMDLIASSSLYLYLKMALKQGWSLDDIYPVGAVLSFQGMRRYADNPNSKFLLTACYEHFYTSGGDGEEPSFFHDADGDEEMEN